jgi:MFS family permease
MRRRGCLKQSLYNVRRSLLQASLGFAANTGKKGGLLKFGSFRSCSEHYIPNSRRSTVPSRMTSSTEQKEKNGTAGSDPDLQAAGGPQQKGSLKALIITLMIQALASAAVLAPTVIAPAIAPALGLSGSSVGIYIAIVYVGAICSTLYSGALVSKWGPIRASQAGLIWCASGLALIAAGIVGLAMIGAVLVGLGYGPITPASSHILIRTTPRHRLSTMFSIKQTGVPLGGVMVGLLVPPQELAFGWAWAILSVSAGCLLMALAGQFVRDEFDTGCAQHVMQSFVNDVLDPIRLVASHPGLRVMAGCSFMFSGVQLAISAYIPT